MFYNTAFKNFLLKIQYNALCDFFCHTHENGYPQPPLSPFLTKEGLGEVDSRSCAEFIEAFTGMTIFQ